MKAAHSELLSKKYRFYNKCWVNYRSSQKWHMIFQIKCRNLKYKDRNEIT